MAPSFTREQNAAISLTGTNVLVSAAAGAGKTSVLVERVIRLILDDALGSDIDRLLVVTFTDKAAQEMKDRVRMALMAKSREAHQSSRIERQLQLLESAQISTIHSFCLKVLRRHFYRAGLDPAFRVLDSNEAALLKIDALEETFESMYTRGDDEGEVFRGLVRRYGGKGMDENLKDTVLSLHSFASTQPDQAAWLKQAAPSRSLFQRYTDFWGLPWTDTLLKAASLELGRAVALTGEAIKICDLPGGPRHYREALLSDLEFYSKHLSILKDGTKDGSFAERLLSFSPVPFLRKKIGSPEEGEIRKRVQDLRKKAKVRFDKIKAFAFLRPFEEVAREESETAGYVECLLGVVALLDEKYSTLKAQKRSLDFSDLERYCLKVLEDDGGRVAEELRSQYDHVFIDEYQDTNPVQERILSLVSNQGPHGNLFMVGDIKQSIYRFRLAEPRIFLEKYRAYRCLGDLTGGSVAEPGVKIDLSKNFRSRQEVLDSVNFLFERIMTEEIADIEYKNGHSLSKGADYPEDWEGRYITEVHLIERNSDAEVETAPDDDLAEDEPQPELEAPTHADDPVEDYEALEREALFVASEISKLVLPSNGYRVWDPSSKTQRPVMYKDIAVLMRATKDRANAVMDILGKWDIPAYADTGSGYFQAREIEVALALLAIIDNPRQDIPLAAVLRSPVVALYPKDLADIRASGRDFEFYDAVVRYSKGDDEPATRVARLLERLEQWRTMARRRPLGEVVWKILNETGYYDYVGGLPGGAQRQANLRALCDRARQFDSYGHHGLYRFLRFIDRLRERESDLGTARSLGEQEDVVRVMSIHKAKGLEFPIVFVMDLGKEFNMKDLRRDILCHRSLGIGAVYCDVDKSIKYPSLIHQAIFARLRFENLAEEMRILYVAMTRAKEKLYLVGSERDLENARTRWGTLDPSMAKKPLDWIGPCVAAEGPTGSPFKVTYWGTPGHTQVAAPPHNKTVWASDYFDKVRSLEVAGLSQGPFRDEIVRRLNWKYPWATSCEIPAKMSVGEIKRRVDFGSEETEFPSPRKRLGMDDSREYVSGVERGIAVHALLSGMRLMPDIALRLDQEARRLADLDFLDIRHLDPRDLDMVKEFLGTPTGRTLLDGQARVRREVPFTMSVPASFWLPANMRGSLVNPDDFVVVQGVIDVLIEDRDGCIILDYKTDRIPLSMLDETAKAYAPQVALYAKAVQDILQRHVTKVCLVFLSLGRQVEVDWEDCLADMGL